MTKAAESTRLIKKYPNRRLYDTHTSAYVTLSDVKQLVMDSEKFIVVDAKSNEDITRSVLLQIILDEEAVNAPIFSAEALAHIIRFHGSTMQSVMAEYLEKNIQAFIVMQETMLEQSKDLSGAQKHNNEAWAQLMRMQAPLMQQAMSSYLEQSQSMFTQMHEHIQGQTFGWFSAFMPNIGATAPKDK